MIPDNKKLREFIEAYFSPDELDTFCFDHFPEIHRNIGDGVRKNEIAKELIGYCERHGRRDELLSLLAQARPSRWRELVQSGDQFRAGSSTESINLSSSLRGPGRLIHPKTGIELIRIVMDSRNQFRYLTGEDGGVPEFWIGRYPVMNFQYKRFLEDKLGHEVPYEDETWAARHNWDPIKRMYPDGKADHPVVLTSWYDALAFCEWAGLRLPTEEEWERAARRDQHNPSWPWGKDWIAGVANTKESRIGDTSAAGSFSPEGDSPSGCADMAGNVWEWTSKSIGDEHLSAAARGGSWGHEQWHAQVTARNLREPNLRSIYFGFRVAISSVSSL